jgi:cytidine deaminase
LVTAQLERLDRTAAAFRLAEFPALLDAALRAQANAWVPYSKFPVGAAVLAADGRIFGGCNVESASYGATICGERTAVASAVTAGAERLLAVVVVTDPAEPSTPCGICRQLLVEFGRDIAVYAASNASDVVLATTVGELLPASFGADDLKEAGQ